MEGIAHKYFGSGQEVIKTESFNLSITSYDASTSTPLHYHENPYLCLLLNGMYEEENRGCKTVLQTGSVLFREAGNEHANVFSNDQGKCLNIELHSANQFMLENELMLPAHELERMGTKEIYSVLHSLRTNQSEDVLNIQCYEALVAHFDNLLVSGKTTWVHRIKEIIHDDTFSEVSLSRFSREFDLHPNYIIRRFKQQTGYKLSEYIIKIRLEKAIAEMLRTDDNLTTVAHSNGFYDQSHFIKNFKKHFGKTPLRFRKSIKG